MAEDALHGGPAAPVADEDLSPTARVRAARTQGLHRFAPIRFRLIEALSRRAESHEGEARRLLDARLAELLSAYRTDFDSARAAMVPDALPTAGTQEGMQARSPIAELVDRLAQHASAMPAGMPATAPDQLKTMRYFSGTWSKLSADRRLRQSRVKLPENAGPLNSHQLVHRALTLMRDVSPAYLNRFMSYVDTLSGIEQMTAAGATGSPAARAEGTRKATRGKPG